jgi:ABC-2 type transport system ATP-binding protein
MRQKLAVGCGWLHQPQAALLDEPFTGPDPRGIRTMKALIREHAAGGAAIIVSSHLLSLFEDLITTVLILHHGKVLRHARLDELRQEAAQGSRHETLEEMFFRLTETAPPPEGITPPGGIVP